MGAAAADVAAGASFSVVAAEPLAVDCAESAWRKGGLQIRGESESNFYNRGERAVRSGSFIGCAVTAPTYVNATVVTNANAWFGLRVWPSPPPETYEGDVLVHAAEW